MIGSAGLTWIVLGLFVIAGAACFIAFRSRRKRMTAGALVVLAAAAGIVIASADPNSTGAVWGGWGAVLAAGFGIVALLRSGSKAHPTAAARRSLTVSSGATQTGDFATPHKRRMSDASLLALTVVTIVIAVGVVFLLAIWSMCSDPTEWC